MFALVLNRYPENRYELENIQDTDEFKREPDLRNHVCSKLVPFCLEAEHANQVSSTKLTSGC